ncbi:outer membrane protein assembly factor BamB/actin-like ATPase involved in cell morphogenesis [Actinoplanes tereljensis]|uniref:Pyrrolo-quinoline quinone repeat domain-containing protein n=1 Tax=Paractinoplanes tereljensis TaxID=571912 RepID=A0A919NNQ0_9ACTN|nr:hsp70 family protein [Actinoplanes tereljensis]GIF21450.1 hypothetical protein Ate02nite_41800 [Actinoplanes tereljensis]
MGEYGLGVDLGTTYTAAATNVDGVVETVRLGGRGPEMPSLVFLRSDGEVLVGDAAQRRGEGEPTRLAREFKRRLGDPVPIMLGGTPMSAHALTARVLRHVTAMVANGQGGPPSRIVLTHPANWGPYKRELLQQAAQLADLRQVTLRSEPEAAAVRYASTARVAVGETIAVYDLGGGTFDAAVLRKTATGFDVLGEPQGVEQLGGIDFDEAILEYVREQLGPNLAEMDLTDPTVTEALTRLRRECVEAKESLSFDTEAEIGVALPRLHTRVRIHRSEFESLISPALDDTIAALRRALRSASVEPADLRCIVLAGGSARIPLVGSLVEEAFGRPAASDEQPELGIALGAARLSGPEGTLREQPAPISSAPPRIASARPANAAASAGRAAAAAGAVAGVAGSGGVPVARGAAAGAAGLAGAGGAGGAAPGRGTGAGHADAGAPGNEAARAAAAGAAAAGISGAGLAGAPGSGAGAPAYGSSGGVAPGSGGLAGAAPNHGSPGGAAPGGGGSGGAAPAYGSPGGAAPGGGGPRNLAGGTASSFSDAAGAHVRPLSPGGPGLPSARVSGSAQVPGRDGGTGNGVSPQQREGVSSGAIPLSVPPGDTASRSWPPPAQAARKRSVKWPIIGGFAAVLVTVAAVSAIVLWPKDRGGGATPAAGSATSEASAPAAAVATVVWKTATGVGAGEPPAVGAELVFVSGADGTLRAYRRSDGGAAWELKLGDGLRASTRVVGGVVYAVTGDGGVYAIDAAKGREVWRRSTGNPIVARPIVDSERVFVGGQDGILYGYRSPTGNGRWRVQVGEVSYPPTVIGGVGIVAGGDGRLHGVNAEGTQLWKPAVGKASGGPVDAGDAACVALADGTARCVRLADGELLPVIKADGTTLTRIYAAAGTLYGAGADGSVGAWDVVTGEKRWRTAATGAGAGFPVVRAGGVDVAFPDGRIVGLDPATGNVLWESRTGEKFDAASRGDETGLYIVGDGGVLYSLRPPGSATATAAPTVTTPAPTTAPTVTKKPTTRPTYRPTKTKSTTTEPTTTPPTTEPTFEPTPADGGNGNGGGNG